MLLIHDHRAGKLKSVYINFMQGTDQSSSESIIIIEQI